MRFFQVRKKVHWSDTDAAGVVWFPNFLGWFEDAEEELYAAVLGRTRQAILDAHGFGMPRVELGQPWLEYLLWSRTLDYAVPVAET